MARRGKAPPAIAALSTSPERGGFSGRRGRRPLQQKTALGELILKGCWVILGKLLVFGADDLADDADDVLGSQAVIAQDLIGGAGVAELILHADAMHEAG